MINTRKNLIVILGPTAVGKTAFCINLSQRLQADIVSSDARQCYQKINIGVAKPTLQEQAAAPHHLIDFLPIEQQYSAGAYEQDALKVLAKLWEKSPYAILTGGSGLYIDAVCQGIPPMPAIPLFIRADLHTIHEQQGLYPLLEELRQKDPEYYQQVDKKNPKRIIRALSVCRASQQPFSFFRKQKIPPRNFNIIKIGLQRPREELYHRIHQRIDVMLEKGLWEEATVLHPYKNFPALATIGYREIFDCLEGKHSKKTAIELIKQNTRHYAKKQHTWFHKDPSIQWFHPHSSSEIQAYITAKVQSPPSP